MNIGLLLSAVLGTSLGSAAKASSAENAEPPGHLSCEQVIDLYDAVKQSCTVSACAALDEDDALGRAAAERYNADCAFRYEWVLDHVATACDMDPYGDNFFPLVQDVIRYWIAAYMCTQDAAHKLFIDRARARVDLAVAALQSSSDDVPEEHMEYLERRGTELATMLPEAEDTCPVCDGNETLSTARHAAKDPWGDVMQHFSLQLGIGVGGVLELVETGVKTTDYTGRRRFGLNTSAAIGGRFTAGKEKRHVLTVGAAYASLRQRLNRVGMPSEIEMNAEHPLDDAIWVHHLGPYARYGYRALRDHLTPYGEIGFAFQVFTEGSNFGTSAVRAGAGVCLVWQIVCIDGGYFWGWGGNLDVPTNFATGWSTTIGADVLRIREAL